MKIWIWVVSGWVLYSVWVRGVNTIVDCCDQWPRPGEAHTVTNLHQDSSIKSAPDHQSIKGTRFHWLTNIRIFFQIKLLWEIMCFYWNKTFLRIMGVDVPNVPGEARDVVYDNLKWARLRPRLSNWGWPEINYQLRAVSGFCLWAEAGPGPGLGLEWCEGPEPEPGPRSQCPEDLGAGSRGETRKISDDWWKFRGSSNYQLVHVFFVLYWFKLGEMNKMCKHGNGRTQKTKQYFKMWS